MEPLTFHFELPLEYRRALHRATIWISVRDNPSTSLLRISVDPEGEDRYYPTPDVKDAPELVWLGYFGERRRAALVTGPGAEE